MIGNEPYATLTVVQTTGSAPREVGAKMTVKADRSIVGTIGGGQLEARAIDDALKAIQAKKSALYSYPLGATAGQCCGGKVEVFIEVQNVGPLLYVFGAGHVGHAVSHVMSETAFQTTLIDSRPEWIRSEKIAAGTLRFEGEWEDFVDDAHWCDQRTFAVIMTHDHATDQKILEVLLKKPTRYLGLIGSETKWSKFKARLTSIGFDSASLARVHCPIGIAPLGKSPKEVAISFAAEILRIQVPE